VQYLPGNWLAAGNLSLVTSLAFRQVFSDDLATIVNPQTESQFFLNNNTGSYNFNVLLQNQTTTIFQPFQVPSTGTDEDLTLRGAPEISFGQFPRKMFSNLPIYLSFDTSFSALSRQEVVDGTKVLATPASVERFDVTPKITVPLPSFGGLSVTPSLTLSGTYYSNSINTSIAPFDPNLFAANTSDPRLDPTSSSFVPGLKVFDPVTMNRISNAGIFRHYAEFDLELRPPALAKDFKNSDGSHKFRHVIEPYMTYRAITGIGQDFNRIILFDDLDAVANTNEVEYGFNNRFFVTKRASDVIRRRYRNLRLNEMAPETGGSGQAGAQAAAQPASPGQKNPSPGAASPGAPGQPSSQQSGQAQSGAQQQAQGQPQSQGQAQDQGQPAAGQQGKGKLAAGQSAELGNRRDEEVTIHRQQRREQVTEQTQNAPVTEQSEIVGSDESVVEAYEFLTIKVAQKYFFDRNFGGAFVPGQRNQFYPVDTLSGFTFEGVSRSFSPVNVEVRYRPLSTVFADLKMDVGSTGEGVRDVAVSGGARMGNLTFAGEWFL
ncbi:MAG: LPS assembly protein LptD, partial [Blastocatellia bacterium]